MLYQIVLSLVFIIGTEAIAKATLKIPLFIEGPESAAKVNKKLKAVGAKLLPEYIEVSTGEDSYEKFKEFDSKIEASLKQLGEAYKYVQRESELVPGQNNKGKLRTCFKGNANEVATLVASLADIAYSDQLSVLGYRYMKTKEIFAEHDVEETEKYINKKSRLWREWRGRGEAVLVLSSYTDSGDDVNDSLISRC